MKLYFLVFVSTLISCKTTVYENEPIARINGTSITVRDYLDLFDSIKPKEHSLSGAERAKIKNLVIKTLIRRQIILDAAAEAQIKLSTEELDLALKEYQQESASSIFEESLLEGMIDEEEWEKRVSQSLLMERLFESRNIEIEKPTLKEALDYYQENSLEFSRRGECSAEHLVVEDETLAKDLQKKIKQNPARFQALAREHSIGPEAKQDARITVEKDIMPVEIDRFLFDSKKGEVSHVIRTSYGFHILKTVRCRPPVNFAFEQVKKEIYNRLKEQKKRAWLQKFEENLIRQASIEYNRKLIKKL